MKSGDDSPGLKLCTASAQITRDADVRLYTGMQNTDAFRTLFEYLLPPPKIQNYKISMAKKHILISQPKEVLFKIPFSHHGGLEVTFKQHINHKTP